MASFAYASLCCNFDPFSLETKYKEVIMVPFVSMPYPSGHCGVHGEQDNNLCDWEDLPQSEHVYSCVLSVRGTMSLPMNLSSMQQETTPPLEAYMVIWSRELTRADH